MLRNFRRRLAAYLAAHYACPGTPR
jgi:hypothetical protein